MNATTVATVNKLQKPDAVRFNLRILERIATSHYAARGADGYVGKYMRKFNIPLEAGDMPALAAYLVRHAEAGTLTNTDSLILGAYAVAILRECAT